MAGSQLNEAAMVLAWTVLSTFGLLSTLHASKEGQQAKEDAARLWERYHGRCAAGWGGRR
jgi:hypothetical protein